MSALAAMGELCEAGSDYVAGVRAELVAAVGINDLGGVAVHVEALMTHGRGDPLGLYTATYGLLTLGRFEEALAYAQLMDENTVAPYSSILYPVFAGQHVSKALASSHVWKYLCGRDERSELVQRFAEGSVASLEVVFRVNFMLSIARDFGAGTLVDVLLSEKISIDEAGWGRLVRFPTEDALRGKTN